MAALGNTRGAREYLTVDVWRDGKTFRPKVYPGTLGVEVSGMPAAEAVRQAQDGDDLLRGALRKSFAPLPGTRGEVEAIAGLFVNSDTLMGARASEQTLDELARRGN